MGRPHRPDPEYGIHHIFSRGTRQWTLFMDDIDRTVFMQRLSTVCTRHRIQAFAYCLMGNHFHLVLQCANGGLSAAMRDLKSFYARRHNDRHGYSGPLFEARFGSRLITSPEYLKVAVRYVHRNPYAIDPQMNLASYHWSTHPLYLAPTGPQPDWLDIGLPRSLFSRDGYQQEVERDSTGADRVRADLREIDLGSASARGPAATASLSSIVLATAQAASCDAEQICANAQNGGLAGVAALIAVEIGGYTAAATAEPLGYRPGRGIHNLISRTRLRVATDPTAKRIYAEARCAVLAQNQL